MHITISIYPVSLNLFIGKLFAENRPSLPRREFEKKIEEIKPLVYQSPAVKEPKSTREIKALMILKGITSINIARKTGVSATWISLVLNGRKPSKRIRKAIAQAVGKPVEELWPNNNKAA